MENLRLEYSVWNLFEPVWKFSLEMKNWIKMVCGACGLVPMTDDDNGEPRRSQTQNEDGRC